MIVHISFQLSCKTEPGEDLENFFYRIIFWVAIEYAEDAVTNIYPRREDAYLRQCLFKIYASPRIAAIDFGSILDLETNLLPFFSKMGSHTAILTVTETSRQRKQQG
ncbi:MAG: hypothetical protein QOE33_469 [Acidobacteriota bacterium]|nr:hypothetical protein [Acidobacteriota bacterium]